MPMRPQIHCPVPEGTKDLRSYQKSLELYERARQSLAGGVSSHFRASEQPHPLFYVRAQGARVWDVDGNEYLDFTLSQGPMILGHSNPAVLDAVHRATSCGQLYAAEHLAELELAEALQRVIPCAELLRFCVTGSEAVQAALRVARAYTGRSKFVKFEGHYHGWLDSVAFSVNPPIGVSESRLDLDPVPWTSGIPVGMENELIVLPWNDLERAEKLLEKRGQEIAAVIAEPIMCNNGCILPEPGFLEGLRQACSRYGIVLIFDEIITGFRVALGGAQDFFKVIPDLAVFGKAMGNGFPISAIVGSRKIMDLLATGKTLQAGTMNAQTAAVAAALVTVAELKENSRQIYGQFREQAEHLRTSLEEAAQHYGHQVLIQGLGPVFHLGFTSLSKVNNYHDTLSYDQNKYHDFCSGMRERGVRLISRGLWYLSTSHTQADIDQCIKAARGTFAELKS
jgi:glutamate-1-semialdehyde 2,1-aminomutase